MMCDGAQKPNVKKRLLLSGLLVVMFTIRPAALYALDILAGPDGKVAPQSLSLPYAFYNENFGAAVGYVHGVVGKPQRQSSLLTTAMAGTQGSAMLFFIGRDLRLPLSQRLFLDPVASIGYFNEADVYIDGNPEYSDSRAGSSSSDKNDFVTGDGWDNYFRLNFKYLLPIGRGRNHIIDVVRIQNGLPMKTVRPTISVNPLAGGKTYLEMRPFYRSQSVENDAVDEEIKTNGVNIGLFWNNRDFDPNPSRGFSIRAKLSRDFGNLDSSGSWTNVDCETDFYIPLSETRYFRQQVLAFSTWISYSPSWEEMPDGDIENRPPAYIGATLGGLWKLRGYPSQRFSDKAAVYYAMEWRVIPHWNPFSRSEWIQRHVGIQWVQFVPFFELGQVAPSWDLSELHRDMKWSFGLGIRAWAKGIVARIDTAASQEDVKIQMMIGHPFQF